MGIVDKLKSTDKGKLSYNRNASSNDLEVLLNQYSSSPELHISPKYSRSVKHLLDNSDQELTESNENFISRQKESPKKPKEPTAQDLQSISSEGSDIHAQLNKSPIIVSPEYGRSKLAIHKYKEEQENKARKARQQRQKQFEENRLRVEREAGRSLQQLEQQAQTNRLMVIQSIVLKHEAQSAEIEKSHQRLKESHEQRREAHYAYIQEAEQVKLRVKQEELRRKQQLNKERQEKLNSCVADLKALGIKIMDAFNGCKYQDKLSDAAKKSIKFIQMLAVQAENICKKCQDAGEVTANDIEECKNILDRSSNAYEFAKQDIERVETEGKKEEEEKEKQAKLEQQRLQQQQQQQQQAAVSSPTVGTPLAASTPRPGTSEALKGKSLCVDLEAFHRYTELQEKLKKVEESTQVLASTPELKKLKFDIQRAVNTPINAISPVSGEHLRDKLKRLLSLLAGQTVEVSGKTVSLKAHPQAVPFCQNLIAKMIVRKGEEQVSSKHDSAFAIAMVAVGLWREQPALGDLFLAHFQAHCPYLVPYYIPRQEGQSDMEYFKSKGYKYEDGVVEKQDKFLKRMSGLMRLYFSMLVSSPPRGSHPHGVEAAWTWLTRVLNLEPEPDITATMIYDFLQVTGHKLCKEYTRQFLKLLHTIIKQLFPKLKTLSSGAGGGALSRLELLLENSVKHQGHIPVPEGYLDSGFWRS